MCTIVHGGSEADKGMALTNRRDGTWQVQWRDRTGRRQIRRFATRADADRYRLAARRRPPLAPAVVYTAYGQNDEVLYIGATDDLEATLAEHRQAAAWWPAVRRLTRRTCPDITSARRRAARLILTLHPTHILPGDG